MLHLECIFALPAPPLSGAENNDVDHRLDGKDSMRTNSDQLRAMDEEALDAAIASIRRASPDGVELAEKQ